MANAAMEFKHTPNDSKKPADAEGAPSIKGGHLPSATSPEGRSVAPLGDRSVAPTGDRSAAIGTYRHNLKRSYGIACCRFNNQLRRYEVLMIRKRYTYAFFSFVFGQYNKNDESQLIEMFNNMTNQEKLDILSLRFDLLWWRIWLMHPPDRPSATSDETWYDACEQKTLWKFLRSPMPAAKCESFYRKRSRFENVFMRDGGLRLNKLIKSSSRSTDLTWEVPKGRANTDESTLDCARREFEEETGMPATRYQLLYDVKMLAYSYVQNRITYCDSYYVAHTTRQGKPRVDFTMSSQLIETDAIMWIGLDDLRNINCKRHTIGLMRSAFKMIRNRSIYKECATATSIPITR